MDSRRAIFISHATPEGNTFTLWLGAKLAALGYEVWADVLRLSGGDDWQRKLEGAIRQRARKVLLVADSCSVQKQGVRNEIQIASDTAKKIGDHEFIVPLRLSKFEAPFLIAHAQYIDFEASWAQGLRELVTALEETYAVPKTAPQNTSLWIALQSMGGRIPLRSSEEVISNWLEVRKTPGAVYFTNNPIRHGNRPKTPSTDFRDGILTCDDIYDGDAERVETASFLQEGWPNLGVRTDDARKLFTRLANQAIDDVLESKTLRMFEMANQQKCWWAGEGLPTGRIGFRWPNWSGSRQLQGFSAKRNVHWHFGVSMSFRSAPCLHVRVKPRLIFSQDQKSPLSSARRMHRLRRSFAKGWRNARWRDMLLAFYKLLGDGSTILDVPMGASEDLVLTIPSMNFTSPISIPPAITSTEPDSDDPDVEFVDDEESLDEEE